MKERSEYHQQTWKRHCDLIMMMNVAIERGCCAPGEWLFEGRVFVK